MMQNINMIVADTKDDMVQFWALRDEYMLRDIFPNDELGRKLTKEDKEWFFSAEYREHMNSLYERKTDRAYPVFFMENDQIIGFCSYCTYLSEDGKCFIIDFCILPEYRNKGKGSICFRFLKETEIARGAAYFALNCSNHRNKYFWEKQDFDYCGEDENGGPYLTLHYDKNPCNKYQDDTTKVVSLLNFIDKRSIYKLFEECFTYLPITENIFYDLFEYRKYDFLVKYERNHLIGFSAVRENKIILLCVSPRHQHKGYGRELVKESEKLIREKGYDAVILGGTDSKLFLGAVTDEKEWNQHHNSFFEKCGYAAANGCLEMAMPLQDYDLDHLDIELNPPDITFEYWNKTDKSKLLSAVGEVEEDWIKYYEYDVTIFAAMKHGKCVGFTILSFDDVTLCSNGYNKVGMVGCVGVIPESRERGIGLAMVAHATNELKKNGCDMSYIHYTYLDRWYKKLGYKTFLWYWFGKKGCK